MSSNWPVTGYSGSVEARRRKSSPPLLFIWRTYSRAAGVLDAVLHAREDMPLVSPGLAERNDGIAVSSIHGCTSPARRASSHKNCLPDRLGALAGARYYFENFFK